MKNFFTAYSSFCAAKLIRINNSFICVSYFVYKVFEVELPVTYMCTVSDSRFIFHKHPNFSFSFHTNPVCKKHVTFFRPAITFFFSPHKDNFEYLISCISNNFAYIEYCTHQCTGNQRIDSYTFCILCGV